MIIEPKLPGVLSSLRIRIDCPTCNTFTNIRLESCTSHATYHQRHLGKIGAIYHCDSCLAPIFISWHVNNYSTSSPVVYGPEFVQLAMPKIDWTYLPPEVKRDFTEALKCFSIECYNAFAAMCRRTIQTICADHSIKGKSKVQKQVDEFKNQIDDEDMSELLDELVKSGHNGAHPYFPIINPARADIILALMVDLLDQIYSRPGRIADAKRLRDNKK